MFIVESYSHFCLVTFLEVFLFTYGPTEYRQFLIRSICPIGGTQKGTTSPGQRGTKSNGNEDVLCIL